MNDTIQMSEYYQHLLKDMPIGLDRNVIAVLLWHVGEENAITGQSLVEELRFFSTAKDLHRQIRKSIQDLRNRGFLIASSAGEHPGYFLPRNRKEFNLFIDAEINSRLQSLSVTKAVMTQTADRIYGKAYQENLFNA